MFKVNSKDTGTMSAFCPESTMKKDNFSVIINFSKLNLFILKNMFLPKINYKETGRCASVFVGYFV